jgi:hypothetical protein
LQLREAVLTEALRGGIAQQPTRRGDEIVVAFRPEFFPEYLANFERYHSEVEVPAVVEVPPVAGAQGVNVPDDFYGPRERRAGGFRSVRDVRFKAFLADHYPGCAICGLRTRPALEGAHIIPVADEHSSDHPSNGVRLCRNCHALFDAGFLLIRPDYGIEVSARFAAAAPDDAALYRDFATLRLPDLDPGYLPAPDKLEYVYNRRQ